MPKIIVQTPPRLASGTKEAAESLGISQSYLYKLARAGRLRLIRIGKRTLVPESELQRLIADAMK